jgi:hypothetical protein
MDGRFFTGREPTDDRGAEGFRRTDRAARRGGIGLIGGIGGHAA